jgi:hypothetical protein
MGCGAGPDRGRERDRDDHRVHETDPVGLIRTSTTAVPVHSKRRVQPLRRAQNQAGAQASGRADCSAI